jgi:hypothetical protein
VALVVLVAVLALGAAAIGASSSPSAEQISLDNAATRTGEASNFTYTFGAQIKSVKGRMITFPFSGVWRAPNQWKVTNLADGATSTTTIAGSTLKVSEGTSQPLVFRFASPGLTESMSSPSSPVMSLPPLGLLSTATEIKHVGDTYSFVIPLLNIDVTGWVAYAPLSHAATSLELTQAVNTKADAVIENGYVTSLSFPDGIRPIRGEALHRTEWNISKIGAATSQDAATSD